MLWMNIWTWAPEKRDEVWKRAEALGTKMPEGVKLLGQWVDLNGCRAFELIDVAAVDPKLILESVWPWSDLCKVEAVAVMEGEEIMKLLPKS